MFPIGPSLKDRGSVNEICQTGFRRSPFAAPAPTSPPSRSACRWPSSCCFLFHKGPLHHTVPVSLHRTARRGRRADPVLLRHQRPGGEVRAEPPRAPRFPGRYPAALERPARAARRSGQPADGGLHRLPQRLQNTFLVQRIRGDPRFSLPARLRRRAGRSDARPARQRCGGARRQLRSDALHHLGDPDSRLPRHRARHHRRHLRGDAGSPGKKHEPGDRRSVLRLRRHRAGPQLDHDNHVLQLPRRAARAGRSSKRSITRSSGSWPIASCASPATAGRSSKRSVRIRKCLSMPPGNLSNGRPKCGRGR